MVISSLVRLQSFSIVGRRYFAGSSRRFSPFFSDRFERRGLVYVGADINNPAQTQATNGSGYWQSHGCVPAQGSGRGYTSENARFEDTHFQSGTDLVGADWEPTLSVANGQPVSQTDALNNTTSYTYNAYGKVLTVTDAENNVTSYTYNLLGQMTSLTDPEGNATSWTYDSMGRVVSETNEKNAARYYQYDDLGRLIQTTDRNGRVIQYAYDYLGRQTAEKWLDSNNAVIASIEYTFDGNNNLLTVTDSISRTDYEYRYDALNRCVYTKVDSDELNLPVEFTYAYNSSDLTVTETLTGLINGVVAPYYQNVYQYDVFGRLENITQTGTGLTAKSIEYFYNKLGQRTGATYKQNGDTVSESAWLYDVAGKVSSIQHKTASDAVFADYGFTWDAGNRITEFETVDGTAEYTYDKTGQLTGADYDYITDELYTYDDNGNRTNAGYVTGENNETLSDGTYRYSYDNEGNRTEKFLWTDSNNDGIIDASEKTLVQTYNWDYRNRLSSVTNYENGIAKEIIDYLYDYLNLMIERTVTDAATSALQSSDFNIYSNGQVVLEYDTTSSVDVVKSINLWGANIDELAAVEQIAQSVNDSNVILWTYGDHLNSIRDIVLYDSITQTAAVVNHLVYNAFGILVSSTDGAANPASISPLLNYRYTGKFFDDSTGLQNNINRWYDNTTGKWLSVDPISYDGSDPNLYRYVGNSVLNSVDTFGLWKRVNKYIYYSDSKTDTFTTLFNKVQEDFPDLIRSGTEEQLKYCVIPYIKYPSVDNYTSPLDNCKYKKATVNDVKTAWENGSIAIHGFYDISYMLKLQHKKTISISIGYDDVLARMSGNNTPNRFIQHMSDLYKIGDQNRNISDKEKIFSKLDSIVKSRGSISQLYIISHGITDDTMGGYSNKKNSRNKQIVTFDVNTLGDPFAMRKWEDAQNGGVPPIAWFTYDANIYFIGCNTDKLASQFASKYLRDESKAWGTNYWMFINKIQNRYVVFFGDSIKKENDNFGNAKVTHFGLIITDNQKPNDPRKGTLPFFSFHPNKNQ